MTPDSSTVAVADDDDTSPEHHKALHFVAGRLSRSIQYSSDHRGLLRLWRRRRRRRSPPTDAVQVDADDSSAHAAPGTVAISPRRAECNRERRRPADYAWRRPPCRRASKRARRPGVVSALLCT